MALPFLSSSLRTLLGSSNSLKGLMPLGVLVSFFITFPIQIADGETRTPDLLITNQLLYHLSYIGKNHYSILSGGRASSTFTFSFRFTPRGSYIGILYQYNTNKLYSNLKNFYVIKYYKFLLTLTKKIFISIILYTETKV